MNANQHSQTRNVIRILLQNLVDDLEQLGLFASGEHPLDDRREDANHFVYFPGLQIKTRDGKKLRIGSRVLRHQQRRRTLGALWIFSFEISAREHRHQLFIVFIRLDNTVQHFGGFVSRTARDV